jgi:hypothetical protein
MGSVPLHKVVSGLTSYEVHSRRPYTEDDQAQYHHVASYTTPEDAREHVKRLRERDKGLPKTAESLKHLGEGQPYKENIK